MMKFFQRLGKALMLPVACLPVCGILMGIGYILAPAAMAGEVQGFTAGGMAYSIGLFLIKAGGALIDNMSWLFAIGVAVGMADDADGTAGLAGLVSMYMITTLLSSGSVAGITGHEAAPAFGKIVNQFVGIVSGLIGATCYNKYKSVKLPDALAFFSGKRAVAIFTALYSIIAALILFFVWPLVYGALVTMGEAFIGMGALGAGIYAFFNRLLIPFGLHHALNSVFWFDVAGINDLSNFWGNTGVYGQTGMYMTGFFPFMMFGLISAYRNLFRKSGKQDAVLAAGSLGYLAVHQLLRIGNLSPISLADGLMTEAYAEHRNLLSQFLHHINADARILRPPRSGGKNDGFRLHGFQLFHRDPVISDDLNIRPDASDQLVQVIRKAVIIIDQHDHDSIPSSAFFTASTTALALFKHSWYSLSGMLSATMPAPDRAYTFPFFA